jgi:hypothetical protein
MQGPDGPTAKRQPSPEGLGIDPEEDPSAGGAVLNRSSVLPVSLAAYQPVSACRGGICGPILEMFSTVRGSTDRQSASARR